MPHLAPRHCKHAADVRVTGEIGKGHLLLVGFTEGDGPDAVRWMADKVVGLRVFTDPDGKMNLALNDVQGDLLVVSQFTLYGDSSKGRRPSFIRAPARSWAASILRNSQRAMSVGSLGRS